VSNFLAVATVTAGLQKLLRETVVLDVSNSDVTIDRPRIIAKPPDKPTVNLFLYQVAANAALRNADLPTRRADGQAVQDPVAALDLNYLITFYGDDTKLEPQRLLGSVERTLHAQPSLPRAVIAEVVTAATDPNHPQHAYLKDTDLGSQPELVRFTPVSLTLEELSKLWASFYQAPYYLSVAYRASVVLLEQTVDRAPALPVLERGVRAAPFARPVIDAVEAQGGPGLPIFFDSVIAIRGSHLRGDVTSLGLGGQLFPVQKASGSRVVVDLATLPAATVRLGGQPLQVVHRTLLGRPPAPHKAVESSPGRLVVSPRVTATAKPVPGRLAVTVDAAVQPDQSASLLLEDPTSGVVVRTLAALDRSVAGTSVQFSVTGLAPGTYLLQVQIDGGLSLRAQAQNGTFTGPLVTI